MRRFIVFIGILGTGLGISCEHPSVKPQLWPESDFRIDTLRFESSEFNGETGLNLAYDPVSQTFFASDYGDDRVLFFNREAGFTHATDVGGDREWNRLNLVSYAGGDSLLIVADGFYIFTFDTVTEAVSRLPINRELEGAGFEPVGRPMAPLIREGDMLYILGSTKRVDFTQTDSTGAFPYFANPLEIRYNMRTRAYKLFGKYPERYRREGTLEYDYLPRRVRLNGASYVVFPMIDSLYRFDDHTGASRSVSMKSVVSDRPFVPMDQTRYRDFTYIYDYSFVNDVYSRIYADPFRELIYVVFLPGRDPSEEMRVSMVNTGFSVIVLDKNLTYQREVWFPPGKYLHYACVVTPEGFAFQTMGSRGKQVREYHVFDLNRGGINALDRVPDDQKQSKPMPLLTYLHERAGVTPDVDSLIVISGLGCSGCLTTEMIGIVKEEADSYAYLVTAQAMENQSVKDFLADRDQVFFDTLSDVRDYRAIGDYLTRIVIHPDSSLTIDDKFIFGNDSQ